MNKRIAWVVLVLFMVAAVLGGCGGQKPADKPADKPAQQEPPKVRDINLATGTTTGVYYVLGNGMAQMWNNKVPNVRASAQATEASVQNMNLLQRKETDIGMSMNQVTGNAYNGKDKFEGRANKDLRVMTAMYPNTVQIVVTAKSGVKSLTDLKGKRFVPGAAGSGTEVSAREILKVHGIDYNADKNVMKVDFVGFTEAVELMKNGQADGALISAGLPNAAVMDLMNSADVKLVSLSPDMVDKIVKEMPWYYPTTIPAGTYKGQTEPINTVAQANLLVTRADLEEDLIYQLTKAIFENKADLVAAHSAAKDITLENALNGLMGVPLHPGAAKYFKEKGLQVPAN
ncbi:C4-dicarboxylate ABC transporter substrate-binding protein [Clostridiales bacterium PH28_bin88]|nr:C4-dicarboxylate ABC transporter substrate-binding protein [Clostridiales bacterium PH28_bin88]